MTAPEIAVEVDQNPYLAPGATRIDAVVTVTATGAAAAPADALEIVIVDCSGSMAGSKILSARQATVALPDLACYRPGYLQVVCVEVGVEGDEEGARPDRDRPRVREESPRAIIRLPQRVADAGHESFVPAAADVGEVLPVRRARGGAVEVDGETERAYCLSRSLRDACSVL